jgi:DNA-binding NtrC family response regulator
MTGTRILLVHPDPAARDRLGSMLRSTRFEIIEAAGDRAAVRMLANPPGLVLHGVDPDEPDALDLLAYVRRKHPKTPVILLVPAQPDRFSRALQMGAVAVLKLPLPADVLRAEVTRAVRAGELANEIATTTASAAIRPLKEAMAAHERAIIAGALGVFGGNRRATAEALAIDRTTLYVKMKKHGLLERADG